MAFTDHKITAFQKKLADLPDQPNLSAAELKAYFDSSPEELRQSLNGVCADADRLDGRVSGIVAGTFGDTIPKAMLSHELQAELDAKAESNVNESAHAEMQAAIATKCEVLFGTYIGDGQPSQFINLGFQPKAVLAFVRGCAMYIGMTNVNGGALAVPGHDVRISGSDVLTIAENGFNVYYNYPSRAFLNSENEIVHYIVFR